MNYRSKESYMIKNKIYFWYLSVQLQLTLQIHIMNHKHNKQSLSKYNQNHKLTKTTLRSLRLLEADIKKNCNLIASNSYIVHNHLTIQS